MTIQIYDTTLRDGTQREGMALSIEDKLKIARELDAFGIPLIEGGWPGSNPKDAEFFRRARAERWHQATICAFGSTRRANAAVAGDPNIIALLNAGTEICTIVGKSWTLHVTDVLETTLDENLRMIAESVAYLRAQGRRVLYDAEHFFDGYRADPGYALATVRAAAEAGAECVILCDTNGGSLPGWVSKVVGEVVAAFERNKEQTNKEQNENQDAQRAPGTQSQGDEENGSRFVQRTPVLGSSELRRFLEARLPHYMVPSAFVQLDSLPLTPNGKLDRRALPQPDADRRDAEQTYVGPRVPVEEQLVGIWSAILGVEPIGIYDNFFQLGGHSLQASRMIAQVSETFQVDLPLRSFFEAPRIADLALVITQQRSVEIEQDELAQLLSQLEHLSEDEIKAFLSS